MRAGDKVRALAADECGGWKAGDVVTVKSVDEAGWVYFDDRDGDERWRLKDDFEPAFTGTRILGHTLSYAFFGGGAALWIAVVAKVWPFGISVASAIAITATGAAIARGLEDNSARILNAFAAAAGWLCGHAYALGKRIAGAF